MRLRAVDAVEGGTHPEDVADALGMARGTVYGWLATYRDGGREALRARPVPGRPPKLTGAQLSRLYGLIVGVDPRQLEFPFASWTREMVGTLIRREFTVHLIRVHRPGLPQAAQSAHIRRSRPPLHRRMIKVN